MNQFNVSHISHSVVESSMEDEEEGGGIQGLSLIWS